MPSLSLTIPNESDQARKILSEIRGRVRASNKKMRDYEDKWKAAEESVLAYLPEREVDARRRAARENGLPQYTTIQIPYSYAVLMSAHTYFCSVFMARNPVFGFTGRHGEPSQSVQAIEALLDYQVIVGQLLGPLYTWMYDAGKYGLGIVGSFWETREEVIVEVSSQPKIDPVFGEPVMQANGQPVLEKIKTSRRVPRYKGNALYNIQPWDFIFDTSFPVRDYQRGEYCGVRRTLSYNECKRRQVMGYYINLDKLSKGSSARADEAMTQGSSELNRPEATDSWAYDPEFTDSFGKDRPSLVKIYEMYIEIIPKEWGLGESDFPEKWVITVTEDFKTLLGVQPHGAYHCKYPFHVLVTEPEGYGLIPRGMPETLQPIQNTIDWLINSHFYNVRAALNNKFVVDPSKVVMKDVLDPLPGGIVRLKPGAYGTDTKSVMTQLPIMDVTRTHLQDLQMMYGMGERTVGVNDQIMGMLNTSGRKTATEIRTSTSFGVNRLKTIAEFFSATGWAPMSQVLLTNTQQYYDETQKFRIAGDLAMSAGQNFMMVSPENIIGSFDFVPVDGALPVDKFALANMWREMMVQVRQMPDVAMQYDFGRMFEWVAQLAGMKNITQFRVEVMPDPLLLQQAKMGNAIPMGKPRASRPPSASGVNEPGQVPGMGATG